MILMPPMGRDFGDVADSETNELFIHRPDLSQHMAVEGTWVLNDCQYWSR